MNTMLINNMFKIIYNMDIIFEIEKLNRKICHFIYTCYVNFIRKKKETYPNKRITFLNYYLYIHVFYILISMSELSICDSTFCRNTLSFILSSKMKF